MSQEINSTEPAEQILSQAISPERKQELVERLAKLKQSLDQYESQVSKQKQEKDSVNKKEVIQELDRRMEILREISSETRANIQSIIQIQLGEKYHPSLQSIVKNLEKVNSAYGMILDGLIS